MPTITPKGAGREPRRRDEHPWPPDEHPPSRDEQPVAAPPPTARRTAAVPSSVDGPWPPADTSGSEAGQARRERSMARRSAGVRGDAGFPTGDVTTAAREPDGADQEEPEVVPVRRLLSLAAATFAGLLGVGLIFGAQTAGVGTTRIPYAIVVFGVQALFVLAWTMATRPPNLLAVAAVGILVAAAADLGAVLPTVATVAPLGYAALAGFLASILVQLLRRADRARVVESLGSTLILVVGVVAFATLIVLTRRPVGTQAIVVCLTATGLALLIARLTDAFLPWPRLADQVPRGALGVILGAMAGTAAAAGLGAYIRGFTPQSAALVGMVAAGAAVLADLGVGYAEASRELAGEPPTLWLARHMQGPLSGFALASPLAYVMSVLFLVPAG